MLKMKTLLFTTLCSALLLSGVLSEPPETTTSTTETTPTETTLTSTDLPITTTASTTSSIEPVPTTTSTPVPTTSTPVPTTTSTPVPTTEPSTTSEAPTKAPKPVVPPVHQGTWNVTEGDVTCIKAELEVLFTIPIEGVDNYIALSPNASTDGSSCSLPNDTQKLVLNGDGYTLTFVFHNKTSKAYVNNITLSYTLDGNTDFVYNDTELFSVNVGNSYLCKSDESVMLSNVTMQLKTVHIEAFGQNNRTEFSTNEECKADDKVGDAVPIAVGCALIALIVVVLIAYLVGRRRSRQKGYQSV